MFNEKTRTKFYISEPHHPKKVLSEYIQILGVTICHTLTNRTKGFQKSCGVQEFHKKVAHIRMWGSHRAHCLSLSLAMVSVVIDQPTPTTRPPAPRNDTHRRAVEHYPTSPIFNTPPKKIKNDNYYYVKC